MTSVCDHGGVLQMAEDYLGAGDYARVVLEGTFRGARAVRTRRGRLPRGAAPALGGRRRGVNSLALLDHQRGRKWSAVRGLLGVERPDPTYQDMMPRTSVRSSPGCCVGRRGWC